VLRHKTERKSMDFVRTPPAIRSDDLDFVHRKKDLDVVVQRIEDRLTGREEVVFK
jgi:hypothetical protein